MMPAPPLTLGVATSSRPPSSDCPNSAVVCLIQGVVAANVAGICRTAGISSCSSWMALGSALSMEAKPCSLCFSVGGSTASARPRASCREAVACIVVLKLVIRSASSVWRLAKAERTWLLFSIVPASWPGCSPWSPAVMLATP